MEKQIDILFAGVSIGLNMIASNIDGSFLFPEEKFWLFKNQKMPVFETITPGKSQSLVVFVYMTVALEEWNII